MSQASAFRPLGDRALWAPRPASSDGDAAFALFLALRACPGVIDAVVTEERVCITFDPAAPPEGLDRALREPPALRSSENPRELVVRVRYDGLDLEEVASQAELSVEEVISRHAGAEYHVRLIGFLPGFAYLGGLDPRLARPRRPVPRSRVAPGSVAIAADYTAVYPFASPGGWHLLGTALDCELFRTETGAALRLGDRVRFERVG
jgi:5-oxoprolinase (ATP-hydrolysing) subunit A